MKKILDFLLLSRPYQWHKNIFVFAPAFFAGRILSEFYQVIFLFFDFILASVSVYSLNDVMDYKEDKEHPIKRNRPVASGRISKLEAVSFSLVIMSISLYIAYLIGSILFVSIYVGLNILYSLFVKWKKPLDIFFISIGFVLRILAGSFVCNIYPSSWLVITTFFLAIFLSTMKRETELHSRIYERIGLVSATLTVASYSLYVVIEKKGLISVLSIFPVFYGIVRYYMIVEGSENRDPSVNVFDREILISSLIWVLLVILEIYF